MRKIILKVLLISGLFGAVFIVVTTLFHTGRYIADTESIGVYFNIFGTLYGILTAFVIFEVWTEYNSTVSLVEREALALNQLYKFALYFRDKKFTPEIKSRISNYINSIIMDEFNELAVQKKCKKSEKLFNEIFLTISDVNFNDDHDAVVFDNIIGHYNRLSEIRSERINQSLTRLPNLLKIFLYLLSLVGIFVFLLLPFTNIYYGIISVVSLVFILGLVFQLIEDLDNPFVGYWNITSEPFEKVLKDMQS